MADRAWRAALLGLALLSACTPVRTDIPANTRQTAAPSNNPVCRSGPGGGPLVTDRGIGGTGAPPTLQQADRGIGGTGIVGVVTGFASLCLAGREVAFNDAVSVRVDGEAASPVVLRVGQLAAVEAVGTDAALRARSIAVRHEAVGPVEAVETNGVLRVAGQRVAVSPQTWMDAPPRQGDWVAISGLREPDGTIHATRLDTHIPGPVLVHGTLVQNGQALQIGALRISLVPGLALLPGRGVTASGHYEDGTLFVDTLVPDVLAENPAAYFGSEVGAVILEGYVAGVAGRVRLRGLDVPSALGLGTFGSHRAVVEFERRPDGSLRATSLREPGVRDPGRQPGMAAATAPRIFEPAPMRNQAMDEGPGGRANVERAVNRGGRSRPDPGRGALGAAAGGFGGGPGVPGGPGGPAGGWSAR